MAIYDFGWPEELVDIHFPHGQAKNKSYPWYWFLTRQTPRYFQYIAPQLGGHGWQCEEFLPVIKILPIDTQPLVPTSEVGFGSIEEAVTRTNNGEPLSMDSWGRFIFGPKGGGIARFFWPVIGKKMPEFSVDKGVPTQKANSTSRPINATIKEAVQLWRDDWNSNANMFNGATQGVSGNGQYTVIGSGAFAIKIPRPNIPLPELSATNGKWYFGPIPPTYIFETGYALFWKQAWGFSMGIAQLDPDQWDMSVFPPKDTTITDPTNPGFTPRPPSSISKNYGGYNLAFAAFPLNGPIIV